MLELKDICFKVQEDGKEKVILNNINIKIDEGDLTVITGPNGGGKSTLAKIIAGIKTPTSGKIILDGEDITDLGITERANKGISFAFQQPVRFKGITVKDLLVLAYNNRPECKGNINIDINPKSYLKQVGLCSKEYLNREVNGSLSGGELKRIEIATILARNTKYSIFDEPEAGIDIWSFNSMINIFEEMRKKEKSMLIISHQERILNIADSIIVIENGQIKDQGKREEVLSKILFTANNCNNCKGE